MTKSAVIIVAGGAGKRFGSRTPKQFLDLFGKPVFMWSLLAFKRTGLFSQIILVAPGGSLKKLMPAAKQYSFDLVRGGKERPDSVKAGLLRLNKDISCVAIHDAARPLIQPEVIERALDCAGKNGSGIVSVPARDTIKLTSGNRIAETIPRDRIWLAQTPQVFKRSMIEKAYSRLGRLSVTDDAQAAELAGFRVFTVMGDYNNIKLTDKADLNIARTILKKQNSFETKEGIVLTGFGYDVHRLKKGRPLILGGVTIPHTKGLLGHSDADVLVHAVMDALLGAAGMDDIGHLFPNTDPRYRNADSIALLKTVVKILAGKKLTVNNIDTSLVCEAPKISPHIKKMKDVLAAALKLPPGRIGVKATTNEGLGFIGRSEGIAALCVATLKKSGK